MVPIAPESVAVLLAGSAAVTFAVANVLQQRAAARLPAAAAFETTVLLRLFARPLWLAGLLAIVVSFGLQAAALGSGRLVVMEPILATSLLIALALSAWLERRRMTGMEWAASIATCAGLGVFLTISQPSGGVAVAAPVPLGVAASGAIVLAAGCAGIAGRLPPARRALLLGIGGGIGAGVTDALTKTVAAQVAAHQAGLLADPQIYLLAVVGISTYTLQQNGYRAASLAAFLPVFAVLDPIVGSGLGLVIYHERLADSPARMVAEAIAAAAATWGIARLARSSAALSAAGGPVLAPPEPPATWPVDLPAAGLGRDPGEHPPVGRPVVDQPGRPVSDLPGREPEGPVSEPGQRLGVGHQQHGLALRAGQQLPHQAVLGVLVKSGGRLVEQQHRGVPQQRPGDRDPAPLADR